MHAQSKQMSAIYALLKAPEDQISVASATPTAQERGDLGCVCVWLCVFVCVPACVFFLLGIPSTMNECIYYIP